VSTPVEEHPVAGLSILSLVGLGGERLLSLVLIAVIAAVFGATGATDAYFLALIVPVTLGVSLSEALYTSLLPSFSRLGSAPTLADATRIGAFVALGAFTVYAIGVAVASPNEIGVWIGFAPVIITSAIGGVYAAALIEQRHYGLAVLRGPIASAAALALTAIFLIAWHSVAAVAVAVSTGNIFVLAVLRRKATGSRGVIEIPLARRDVLGRASSVFAATLIGGPLAVLVERALAAGLAKGSIAELAFARGFALFPVLLAQALANGMFPAAADRFVSFRDTRLRELTLVSLRLGIATALAISLLVILARNEIIRLALERGKLDPSAAGTTARLVGLFALSVVGVSAAAIGGRGLFAIRRQRAVAFVSVGGVLFYVVAAVVLRDAWGIDGLALAFSLSSLGAGAAVVLLLGRALNFSARTMFHEWIAAPSALAFVFAAGALAGWVPTYRLEGASGAAATLSAASLSGAVALAATLWIVRPKETALLKGAWTRRFAS
jgi:putative peptidoglycan lipid II flippase